MSLGFVLLFLAFAILIGITRLNKSVADSIVYNHWFYKTFYILCMVYSLITMLSSLEIYPNNRFVEYLSLLNLSLFITLSFLMVSIVVTNYPSTWCINSKNLEKYDFAENKSLFNQANPP